MFLEALNYCDSFYREEVARELKSALSHIKLAQSGVYVQASTLGSLEALLEFLRTSKIPVSGLGEIMYIRLDVLLLNTGNESTFDING